MESKLKQIMSNIFEINEEKITNDISTDTVDTWDSLNHLNLIVSIEEQFDISISEDEMTEMTSFSDIKRVLRNKGIEI